MLDTSKRSATQGYSFVQILDRSFRIYRQNFLQLFTLSAIVQIPLVLLGSLITVPQQQALLKFSRTTTAGTASSLPDAQALLSTVIGVYAIIIGLALFIGFLQGILIYAPIVFITSENHLDRRATLGEAFAAIGKRLQPLAGGLILFYGIVLVFGVALAFTLFLCGLGLGLWLYASLILGSLLIPVLILERTTVGTALGRSWTLGKKRVWVLFGISIGFNLIITLVDLGLAALVTQLFHNNTTGAVLTLTSVLGAIGSVIVMPLLPIAFTETYYDIRNRFEGLDIALRAVTTPNPSPADVQSPAPARLIGQEDYLNIALFAVGSLVLVILYVIVVLSLAPSLAGLSGTL